MHRILVESPLGRLVVLALRKAGYQAYVVGGAVRDLFLQREPNDIDIATDMPATDMHTLAFDDDVFQTASVEPARVTFIPVGVEFGVCAFAMNGEVIEVANFRKDLAFDGRHRGVTVGVADSIEEDLVRRDFSMNAMAMDPFEEDDDKALMDPFGGRQAVARGVVSTPGSPESSFEQDALRVLRAVRFMAKFGFALDPALMKAARKRLVRKRFRLLSPERIRDELVKILEVEDGKSVATSFTVLQEMRILELFMPELSALADLPYRKEYHTERGSVWAHIARVEPHRPGCHAPHGGVGTRHGEGFHAGPFHLRDSRSCPGFSGSHEGSDETFEDVLIGDGCNRAARGFPYGYFGGRETA